MQFIGKPKTQIVLLVIVIIIVAFSVLISRFLYPNSKTSEQTQPSRVFPSSISYLVNSDFSLTYETKGDNTGRSVLYSISSKAKFGSGIGEVYSGDNLSHAVGIFSSWESIPNSKDKYIDLIDPRNNEEMGKYRVVFSPNNLFKFNDHKTTELQIADLNVIIRNNTYKGAFEHLYYFDEVSDVTLPKLIQNGDAIHLASSYYMNGISPILSDDKGIPYASVIFIRRYGGKEELAKEL